MFLRHQGAIKRLDVYMTSDLCVRKIFWATLKRVIEKGREWLRNDEDLSTDSHSLVEEVRHILGWNQLFEVALEHWHRWDRQ